MKMTWLLVWICLLTTAASHAARLTGIMIFSCDARGNPAGDFIWDTRGLDSDFYKVWLTDGSPDPVSAPFLNGPSWAEAPLDLELVAGENTFHVFFENNGPWPFFAANFFFDGDLLPAISVKAPLRTSSRVSRFSANRSDLTYTLTSYPHPNAPASGATHVRLDQIVRLKEWSVASPAIFASDRVDTHQIVPNGDSDYVATFTLGLGKARGPVKNGQDDK